MNRQFLKRMSISLLASSALIALVPGFSAKAENQTIAFSDVDYRHWGYNTILWGKQQGIVDGYEDGSYKPDQVVQQTEFIAMLIRAYIPTTKLPDGDNAHWASSYLKYAFNMGWGGSIISSPSSDLSTIGKYDFPEARMYVAKLITNANGRNYSPNDSIQFMLDSNLADGKTEKTVEGFKGGDFLTRAEAITFIKNLKDKQSMLYPSPGIEEKYNPSTVSFTAFEMYPLVVETPQVNDNVARFSKLSLTSLKTGYNVAENSSFTVNADVEVTIGPGLIVKTEEWKDGFFHPNSEETVSVHTGKLTEKLNFSNVGVYRISVYSYYEKNGAITDLKIPITSFYVENKNK